MKQKLHLVSVSAAAPKSFGFYTRLVYTGLLRSGGRRKSVSALSKYLGVSRNAVSNARDTLIGLGLATINRGKVVALMPSGVYQGTERWEWFYHLKNQPTWWKNFHYFKFPMPSRSCPLDHRGCALLGYLCSRARKTNKASNLTYSYVAVNIGIDYRTVAKTLVALDDHGFIEHEWKSDRDRFSVPILDALAQPDWFRDRFESAEPADKSDGIGLAPEAQSDRMVIPFKILSSEIRNPVDQDTQIDPTHPRIGEADTDPRGLVDPNRSLIDRALTERYGKAVSPNLRHALVYGNRSSCAPSVGEVLNMIERHDTPGQLTTAIVAHSDRNRERLFR